MTVSPASEFLVELGKPTAGLSRIAVRDWWWWFMGFVLTCPWIPSVLVSRALGGNSESLWVGVPCHAVWLSLWACPEAPSASSASSCLGDAAGAVCEPGPPAWSCRLGSPSSCCPAVCCFVTLFQRLRFLRCSPSVLLDLLLGSGLVWAQP